MEKRLSTSQGSFLIRPYKAEDRAKFKKLWSTCFNKEMPTEEFQWKYEKNPEGFIMVLCFNEDGHPVVAYGCLLYRVHRNGQTTIWWQTVDIMSHPKYRGLISGRQGLFVETAKWFDEYAKTIGSKPQFGFPGERSYRLGSLLLNFIKADPEPGYLELPVKSHLLNRFKRKNIHFTEVDHFDQRVDQLWQSLSKDYSFAVVRDLAYLNWRFDQRPAVQYQKYYLHRPNSRDTEGYAVFRIISNKEVVLVDLLVSPQEKTIREVVHSMTALPFLKNKTLKLWLSSRNKLFSSLKKTGFQSFNEPWKWQPCFKLANDQPPQIPFFYTLGDADLY